MMKENITIRYAANAVLLFVIFASLVLCVTSCEQDPDFREFPKPEITVEDFTPKSGRPGTRLTITGTNFGEEKGAARIAFNGATVEGDSIVSYADTEMVVTVPEDAGTGPVSVTVWGYTQVTADDFTYIPGASITRVDPEQGQPGDEVTVTGTNFSPDINKVSVFIGETPAEVISATETGIKFKVPDTESNTIVLDIEGQEIEGPYFLIGDELITGTLIGHEGSWGDNPDTEITAAVDGNITTAVDAPSATGYVGYDMGVGKAAQLTSVRYVPRESHPQRMVGGEIRGANDPTLSDAVTLHTITEEPPAGIYTDVSITATESYRYIYYYSEDGNCNIAEIEFYGNVVEAVIPEGKYVFEFNTSGADDWIPQQDASWIVEDGQLKVMFNASQFDGTNKRRADLKYDIANKGNWIYTNEYPIMAMKITNRPAEGNLRWDIPDIGSFDNNDHHSDFEAQDVIYWDFSEKSTESRIETGRVVQLKIADITSAETGYEVHWIRTFKNVEELSDFIQQ